MKSSTVKCYFLSYHDILSLIRERELVIQRLRDIALYKITLMKIELKNFESFLYHIVRFIRKANLPADKQDKRHEKVRKQLERGVNSFFEGKIAGYGVSRGSIIEVRDMFLNHLIRATEAGTNQKYNDLSDLLMMTVSYHHIQKEEKIIDKNIPEEKDKDIELPVFTLNPRRIMEPEPEHMFAMYRGKENNNASRKEEEGINMTTTEPKTNRIKKFHAHNNFRRMTKNTEEIESSPFNNTDSNDMDFEYSREQVNSPIPRVHDHFVKMPTTKNSYAKSMDMDSHSFFDPRKQHSLAFMGLEPMKVGSCKSVNKNFSKPMSPRQNSSQSRVVRLQRDFGTVNDIKDIESMLNNYFALDLKGVKDLLNQKATSIDGIVPANQEFHNCLLEYLENKDIQDMDPENITFDPEAQIGITKQRDTGIGENGPNVDNYLDHGDTSIDSRDYPAECFSYAREQQTDNDPMDSNPYILDDNHQGKHREILSDNVDPEWAIEFLQVEWTHPRPRLRMWRNVIFA